MVSDGELVYLFQLREGQIRTSLAIEVVKANGIPDAHIIRANEVEKFNKKCPSNSQ